MHGSLTNMAQLTLNASYDMTQVNAFRSAAKAADDNASITLNDVIVFAVSRTLPNHPDLNAHYYDDKMVRFKHVNLGVAVDTPRGLLVPVIPAAELMSLGDLSRTVKEKVSAAVAGKLLPDDMKGGTFTVTNLGVLGIESFTPIINPPQTGILGVNTIETRVRENNLETYKAMTLSLTFDHRAIDGAPAARFLQELVRNLESFSEFSR